MLAKDTKYVVFDVETTGLSPLDGDRIIEIAAVRMKKGEILETFESFINPEREIPQAAQRINNITPDMVADAPKAESVLPDFVEFVAGACLCGQNVKFDLDFVCFQLSLIGRALHEHTPALDTIKMAKYFLPHLSTYRLSNLASAFGLKVDVTHRALADVQLTSGILNRLLIMAYEQGITQFQDIISDFGVQKPVFKVEQGQDLLF